MIRHIDQAQYQDRAGPCVQAILTGEETTVHHPGPDWTTFSDEAAQAGVRSVWSLPLSVRERTTGALNLYSTTETDLGGPRHRSRAEAWPARLRSCWPTPPPLMSTQLTNQHLQEALASRDLIGQAKGILMARQSISADDAFDILRRASQRSEPQTTRRRRRPRSPESTDPRTGPDRWNPSRAAALEAARDMLGLPLPQLWLDYLGLGGNLPPAAIGAALLGTTPDWATTTTTCSSKPSTNTSSIAPRTIPSPTPTNYHPNPESAQIPRAGPDASHLGRERRHRTTDLPPTPGGTFRPSPRFGSGAAPAPAAAQQPSSRVGPRQRTRHQSHKALKPAPKVAEAAPTDTQHSSPSESRASRWPVGMTRTGPATYESISVDRADIDSDIGGHASVPAPSEPG